jgi:hypothetical protein
MFETEKPTNIEAREAEVDKTFGKHGNIEIS